MVTVIPYDDQYAAAFRDINMEWLEASGLTEPLDLKILARPRQEIIDIGGIIFLAVAGDVLVGSAALIPMGDGEYELAKVAVVPAWQGKGVGALLMDKCVEQAKAWRARTILLYSHSKLASAVRLYLKFGFVFAPLENSHFETADIKMVLNLIQSP